jgi:hypothetical protein
VFFYGLRKLSESGFPGLKDEQDESDLFLLKIATYYLIITFFNPKVIFLYPLLLNIVRGCLKSLTWAISRSVEC